MKTDFEAPISSWPFWRASIIVTICGGVLGALLGLLSQ